MANPSWSRPFERRVTRWAAAGLGPSWVVAVSGGGDSVGLLRALHAIAPGAGVVLSVAHLDHGARGEAGRDDAAFVEALARSLGLPCDLGRWQPTRTGHFEADARRARYDWLAGVARGRGARVVAVGHNRDDQAETVLHRVVRGTGVRGLAGIPARRALGEGVVLVRPLLDVPRRELRDYLDGLGQDYREDASNADPARTRARLRNDLLPKLAAEYNPRVADALARLAGLAAASTRAYRERVRDVERAATASADPGRVTFRRDALMSVPAFLRAEVLRRTWRRAGWPEAGIGAKRWRRLAALVRRTQEGRFDVGGGVVAATGPLFFTLGLSSPLVRPDDAVPSEPLPLDLPGSALWPGGRVVLTLDPEAPRDETIDLDRVAPPLWVRAPRPGDRFQALGMAGHAMPLNDFFRGRRVPPGQRARTPLVCDRAGILWVVGHRISDRVRATDRTTRRLGLRWEVGSG